MTSRPPYDLSDRLPYLINRVGAALATGFGRESLAHFHLTIVMWRVLVVLSNKGKQRQIDLSDMTSIDVSTLSRLITQLARMDLVVRRRSKTNNREVAVQLTAKGSAIVEQLLPVVIGYEKITVAGLSAQEVKFIKRCLRKMYENILQWQNRERSPDAIKAPLQRARPGRKKSTKARPRNPR